MGLFIVALSGATTAVFGLGYKIRKHYGFSIIHLSFLFSVSIIIFALIYILIYGHPIYSKASLMIGAPIGACFALAIYFYQQVLEKANLNISWTVIQFSVLIPFFFSMIAYHERPSIQAIIGVVLIFVSIILFGIKKERTRQSAIPDIKTALFLFFAAFLSGVNDAFAKVYVSSFNGESPFSLFLYTGITMSVITGIILLHRKEVLISGRKRWGLVLNGLYMGFFSVSGAALLITGLRSVDGSIAYPLRNAVNIIMIFIFSYFFFKEKARPIELVGTGTALAGLVIVTSVTGG